MGDPTRREAASDGSESSATPRFDRNFFGGQASFTRIGDGEVGGKAAGLELIRDSILPALDPSAHPGVEVVVPTTTVLTTRVFDEFMAQNELHELALSGAADDRIAHAFMRASMPAAFVGDLRALVNEVRQPLAVRSSSLLEDALDHPFAGVYGTKMIPNNEPDADSRFRKLVLAVKYVYASTFFKEACDYMRSIGQELGTEKMAVVIQEVVGRRRGPRFYPTVSAVARSYDYYPTGRSRPEDGVVDIASGLGKYIVDGGVTWSFAPPYPKAPPPFNSIGELLKNTQTKCFAVSLGAPALPDPTREEEHLVTCGLREVEYDGELKYLVSTYDARSDQLRPGLMRGGAKALTFAPLIGGTSVPFVSAVSSLMAAATEASGAPVEIEMAATLDRDSGVPARLVVLQVRPMRVSDDHVEVAQEDLEAPGVVLSSTNVLGNAMRDDIRDVVYVRPDVFDARNTRLIAMEIDQINQRLVDEGTPYMLIGFGRWGSSDPWLGVPVNWSQIGGARVIVEATLPKMNPDLSQGSHFFHNLISFQVLYLHVEHGQLQAIDWQWLNGWPATNETENVRHVRFYEPLEVRVDGRNGRGVVLRGS